MMRSYVSEFALWIIRAPGRRIAAAVGIGLASIAIWFSVHNAGAQPAAAGRHGLTGSYYVSDVPVDRDLRLPKPARDPEGTRTDSQIAFGQGAGFHSGVTEAGLGAWADQPAFKGGGRRLGWLKAVIWRGFIRLPKAGTYYFTTVSDGSSAVYLNRARIALNGPASIYGALINSDAFGYDKADIQDFVENVRGTPFYKRIEDSYVVPVTVSGPRDLPIEVDYAPSGVGVIGIDLMWVTPDSPKDSGGKPIAKIVPSEALYTEASGPIESPAVYGASSMISADHYCAGVNETKPLAVTFRLADKNGRPVAGKRVFFNTLDDDKFGYDVITQPENPTDENGITTAQLKSDPMARPHSAAIYATDVTDLVDIGQVAHVRFPAVNEGFFASPCTAGFDPNLITVEPLPMMAGRPLTLRVKLENRQKADVELTATFQATDWNIGANTWKDIGRIGNIRLKPGQAKDVSLTWTPTVEQVHQCFRVQLSGGAKSAVRSNPQVLAAAFVPPELLRVADSTGDSGGGSVQRNVGPVEPGLDPCDQYKNKYGPESPYPGNLGPPPEDRIDIGIGPGDPEYWYDLANRLRAAALGTADPKLKQQRNDLADCFQWEASGNGFGQDQKPWATALARQSRTDEDTDQRLLAKCPPGNADCVATWTARRIADAEDARYYDQLADDPPAPVYRGLGVAKTDTPAAYIDVLRVSLERYKAAETNADRDWMARHFTAMHLYQKRLADSLSREADELQKKAEALPADDPQELQAARDALIASLKRGEAFPADRIGALHQAGMNDQQIKSLRDDLIAHSSDPVQGSKAALLQAAAEKRTEAKSWTAMAARSAAAGKDGQAGQPETQMFNLSNPHDRPEEVHLFIEPIAVPTDWKLSVVNAGQAATNPGAAGRAAPQPEFPIYEVRPGLEYRVTLPAKRQIKVASVLVPLGEVGPNTSARWAVEGRIGNEVIGTMVQEMNTPYLVADLKLPPVGSQEQMEEGAPLTSPPTRSPARIAVAATGAAVLALFVFVMWRRRRRASAL